MKPKFPNLKNLILYSFLSLLITIIFSSIYFSTNSYADNLEKYVFYFPFEKGIPFIPEFILIYLSLNFLMTMPLFYLETSEMIDYGVKLIFGTMLAGLLFIIFPGQLGFERILPEGLLRPLYIKLFDIDGPNNLAPSLHILYTYLTVITLTQKTNSKKWHIWGALICLSVVFTHQHHIIDILSALVLTYPLSKIKASQLFQRGLSFFYKM